MKVDISKTLIGFDFGTKSIGVAIGQTITKTAKPLLSLKANQGIPHWEIIATLIKEWRPDAFIVGAPLNMDGTDQKISIAAKNFADELSARFKLPVYRMDERLTTIEARRKLFEQGGYRALDKPMVDAVAAQVILESWMNVN